MKAISAEVPDWTRERPRQFWDPSRKLLRSIRDYQQASGTFAKAKRLLAVLRHLFWTVITQADIPLTVQIGGGLLIPHPNGIVIHSRVRIGPNCLIFQQVTVGMVADVHDVPVIEGHVDIGAGARILGPIRIGRDSRIGANAVVLEDVPAGATAVGMPARARPSKVRKKETA